MQNTIKNRTIFCKDNIDILQGIDSDSIDLVYLDPPFNKKREFSAPIGSSAEGASFTDLFKLEDIKEEWVESIQQDNEKLYNFLLGIRNIDGRHSYNFCYTAYIAIRLVQCHRILKETGSLYLHCDPTMSHYLKITLDCIFGNDNFRNEVAWHYKTYQGKVSTYYPKKHDIIFWYTKNQSKFTKRNVFQLEYADNYKDTVDFKRWEKYFVNGNQIKYGKHPTTDSRFTQYLKKWISEKGRDPKQGETIYECNGFVIDDVWQDIQALDPKDKTENLGYPTQKPLALLRRIINSSTNESDVVLDPFCGCATTCVASEQLGRQWFGIDISVKAYELVKERLNKDVADENDMLKYKNEVHFSTDAPKRTDQGKNYQEKKWVYVIANKSYPNEYKVGIASNWKSRLNSYQTSDPNRGYTMEHKVETSKFRELERHIHQIFENRHEWVQADLKDIKKAMKKFLED